MAKKRKKVEPSVRDGKQRAVGKPLPDPVPARAVKVRQAGPRYFVAVFGPVTMETLDPPVPVPKK